MKKTLKILMFVFVGVLFLTGLKAKANSNLVEAIEGASIRTEGVQGLRFYAKLDESVIENKHGFYLIYGVATVNELETALDNKVDGKAYLNDQVVFEVNVPGVTQDNEFSVVLTEIPATGYFQNITVIPYVVVNDKNVYASNASTRSVAAVALNMANSGKDISEISEVETILETPLKKYKLNSSGNYELSSGVYETNHVNLRNEFIKDWNKKFKTSWTEIVADDFWDSVKVGLEDERNANKNLSESNIYKFFNDEFYGEKWGWFLDYIEGQCGITHASRQVVAIKGDGTNGDFLLYHAQHLSYSISNFFNQDNNQGGMTAINFKELHRYNVVKEHNNKIYIDATTYEFYNVGDVISTPDVLGDKTGYTFEGYKVGEDTLAASTNYTIDGDVVFVPQYDLINYIVKFYDGEVELTELEKTYTVESGLSLGTTDKTSFIFDGWYDNKNLSGNAISSISKGVIGDLVFYAKFNEGVTVTYDLGEYGNVSPKTKSQLFDDLIADWKEVYGRATLTQERFYEESYFNPTSYSFNFFISEPYGSKYSWLYNYILDVAEELDYEKLEDLQNNVAGPWRINIHAFFNETVHTHSGAGLTSMDFTDNDELSRGFWKYTNYDKVVVKAVNGGSLYDSNLVNSCCSDHVFAGWYLNPSFSGNALTKLPDVINENITIYAKWDFHPKIIYDYGTYGYISDKTKEELFLEFVEDYIVVFGRQKPVEDLMTDFFANSGLPTENDPPLDYQAYGDVTKIFRYDNNKWAWLQEFILDLAGELSYKNRQALIDGNQGTWRSNFQAFFTNTEYIRLDLEYTRSINFSDLNNANGFWRYAPFVETGKVVDFKTATALLSGSTITTWYKDYEFRGWYDNPSFDGKPITKLPDSLDKGLFLFAKWGDSIVVTYDLGEYGYINDKTKQQLFEDFATDYKDLYGRTATEVQELIDSFAAKSYIPGDIKDIFQPSYKNGKWVWLYNYLMVVAEEQEYAEKSKLEAWNQTTWRTNIEAFFNNKQFNYASASDSMDFTSEEMNNKFWQDLTTYNLVYEKSDLSGLLNLSMVKSWNSSYKAVGFVDKDGNAITSLDDITDPMTIYVKWELK